MTSKPRYTMTISRLTVDKLGVKLYDRVSAVIAELIANSYDADATLVTVEAPMGELLANKAKGQTVDKGLQIVVRDNGAGMTPDEINGYYLQVGKERRADTRGDRSKRFNRKVMGRKGVGKLAPFGICSRIDVVSSGGSLVKGLGVDGKERTGYLTAHLLLDRENILADTDEKYHPDAGPLDGTVAAEPGTTLTLTRFAHRWVPETDDFERQLAQRFGLAAPNWAIELVDNTKTPSDPARSRLVGAFRVEKMDETQLLLDPGKPDAGFSHEGKFYPVTGWLAYSKHPFKDDLMAGVRIYCRGKIAAQTSIFNMKAGFTGEHDVRSYLMGELHADWLDEDEDLIQTDRRDILWSHELGQELERWGQALVKRLGKEARPSFKKKVWERFREVTNLDKRVADAFPLSEQEPLRKNALDLARMFGQTIREGELEDQTVVEPLVQLTLDLAPHVTLTKMLHDAADSADSPLEVLTGLLKTARIAELSSFGRIAEDRVKIIRKIEQLRDTPGTLEAAFQELLTQAPWLVDPQWSPVVANQSFATLKAELQKLFKERTGSDLVLDPLSTPKKRADFVLSSQDNVLQLVEIKPPGHGFDKVDLERLNRYVELMEEFFAKPGNKQFLAAFGTFHVTLVCDELNLKGVPKAAFDGLKSKGVLTHITWSVFMLRTRKMHEDYLKLAETLRRNATRA